MIGILTTGTQPIFLQCDNNLQKHRENWPSSLTALLFCARAKDIEPIYAANSGPIIRKPFYSGKRSVSSYFPARRNRAFSVQDVSVRPVFGRRVTHPTSAVTIGIILPIKQIFIGYSTKKPYTKRKSRHAKPKNASTKKPRPGLNREGLG
ncbi:hypothetical protein [Pseudomonas sp. Irchel 3E20]|uniref:hypothetical protein n=1 Tax=Pseudomonas sp. Irchel 3E20 TaxID=2008983 RepID=UPI001140624B|nr:hypothetical protein [Pseudomonas sp. Irchel 3E20]